MPLAVHLENGRVEMRDVPRSERRPGFARLRLLTAGICNTDLELQRGYYGFSGTPGHEFVAEVIESDDSELRGQRVVGEINLACGECEMCRRGLGRHCPFRTVLGIVKHPGAFADEILLPERNLHIVPDRVANDHAVFTEPLAAACEIVDQVHVPPAAEVAVLGDGKLGLLIAQVLLAHGARVTHFGRHKEKLRISEAAGAATHTTDGLPEAAFEFVVDATGSPEGLKQAVAMTRPRGKLIMKSTVHDRVFIDTAPIIVNEITLIGSRCGRFEPALDLLRRGCIVVDPLIAARYPLSRAPEAFAHAAQRGTLKVLLDNR
jgi:threonine dehydrogenase-like Zn-dependent dehydrogenase